MCRGAVNPADHLIGLMPVNPLTGYFNDNYAPLGFWLPG